MKIQLSNFKALFIIACIITVLTAFTKCDAQSFAGKWNRVSGKQYFTADAAKKLGKPFIEVPTESAGSEVVEFKADHTYSQVLSGSYQPKPMVLTGTWTVSGGQLTLKLDAHQPDPKYNPKSEASSISLVPYTVTGSKMTLSYQLAAGNPMSSRITKIEEVFQKM
ncbi:MAG: hypothetical protein ABI863_02890 [Ginsengibacter sp.]